jgi:DNA-binding PadR family transcriptional regulator
MNRKMALLLRHFLVRRSAGVPVSYMSANSQCGMGSASFYPRIVRLEFEGWVRAFDETVPKGENRPPRRLYELTPTGAEKAREALAAYSSLPTVWDKLFGRRR